MSALTGPAVSWRQALGWRLRRQSVAPPGEADTVAVVRRLAGVQAQVLSAAELAVAVRRAEPGPGGVAAALAEGRLLRTWAHRGTLHVLPATGAADHLALLATARSWHRASWQRSFAPLAVMDTLAEQVPLALAHGPLTRAELVEEVREHTTDPRVADWLASGWGVLLKPLAWQGLLCHGPPRGRNVTFARPDLHVPGWPGLPEPDDAARVVVRSYLAAHGPATPEAFDAWLLRGASRRADLRRWFAQLGAELTVLDVEGRPAYLLTEDVDELASSRPGSGSRPGSESGPGPGSGPGSGLDAVQLLPAFDQYVLGPGTGDPAVVPPEHRARVSRPGGWISPVALHRGRVAGTWAAGDGGPAVTPFAPGALPADAVAEAVRRLAAVLAAAGPAADEAPPDGAA